RAAGAQRARYRLRGVRRTAGHPVLPDRTCLGDHLRGHRRRPPPGAGGRGAGYRRSRPAAAGGLAGHPDAEAKLGEQLTATREVLTQERTTARTYDLTHEILYLTHLDSKITTE